MTMHDLNLASQFCDRIIMLHNGKNFFDGKPEVIMTKENILQVYGAKVEILNFYDSCCYSGVSANTYRGVVASVVKNIGFGEFELLFDKSHREHKISSSVVDVIDDKIADLRYRYQ